MNSEFTKEQIDHKDECGEYREAIFKEVRSTINCDGYPPKVFKELCGTWLNSFISKYKDNKDMEYRAEIAISEDGSASSRGLIDEWESPKDIWKLNENGSVCKWTYIDPMPEYGILSPTFDEECFHILFLNKDEFVTFNGDASILEHYKRK